MEERIAATRQAMQAAGITSLIVTDPFNLLYLCGFHGLAGDGCLVITAQQARLITDQRYQTEMEAQLTNTTIQLHITRDYYRTAAELVDAKGSVGFENSLSFATFEQLRELLTDRLVAVDQLVERLRMRKDAAEVAAIKTGGQLADAAYVALLQFVHAGMTERRGAQFLFDWLFSHGAGKPSFDPIVVSGVRSALPHGVASEKVIQAGEMVTVDFGFYYHDYTFDLTRTFAVGEPGSELRRAYAVVQTAQSRMIEAMHVGAMTQQVDAAARDYIVAQGYGQFFGHGSGHGIGLSIHEAPVLNPRNNASIASGYVLTAEPGIYLPGRGGIRIEDDVLISPAGPKLLTHSSRDLVVITA